MDDVVDEARMPVGRRLNLRYGNIRAAFIQ
jgi:hypothetical protein